MCSWISRASIMKLKGPLPCGMICREEPLSCLCVCVCSSLTLSVWTLLINQRLVKIAPVHFNPCSEGYECLLTNALSVAEGFANARHTEQLIVCQPFLFVPSLKWNTMEWLFEGFVIISQNPWTEDRKINQMDFHCLSEPFIFPLPLSLCTSGCNAE